MKRAMPLLAVLIATAALAEPESMPPQAFQTMPGAYYPVMPYGMPMQPVMPYGMPMQQMPYDMAMPPMPAMPYGMPMQQMPYSMAMPPAVMPYGMPMQQMPAIPYGLPYPALPTAMPAEATPVAMPAAAPAAVPVAAPAPVPAPAPVVAPFPATAPTQAPASAFTSANPYLPNASFNPLGMMMGMGHSSGPKRPYEMRRVIGQDEKTQMVQMFLPLMTGFMQMGMPDAMNYFARKYKAKPGLSYDDVRDSLFLRANQLNMKKVGESLMWKDFQAVLGDMDAPRIEVYSFCDIAVARDLLKVSPEFVVYLPCRVAIMEDADKNVWVLMVDWNLDWITGYESKLGLTPELAKGARSINERMDEMMRAAANGDL